MIEILAVFAIIGVLAAVAVPSMLVFVERGNQMNRTNIARTVYLAAQNQLTEMRVTKTLNTGLASDYWDDIKGDYKDDTYLMGNKNVYTELHALGDYLPAEETEQNKKYVHYISKAAGATDLSDPVIALLDPVILDKSILNSAILIEYNIKTGVVLSVFYGDSVQSGYALGYSGDGIDSVYGTRGMGEGGYAHADERKQGYYGVEYTGKLDKSLDTTIKVYDTYDVKKDYKDYENGEIDKSLPPEYFTALSDNMLYAEIKIPTEYLESGEFNLLINGEPVEEGISFTSLNGDENKKEDVSKAFERYPPAPDKTALLYRYDGDITDDYARIFWVLDYVGGDMTVKGTGGNAGHSIYEKYAKIFPEAKIERGQNLRVGISGDVSAASFTEAHPYFLTEPQGKYSPNKSDIFYFAVKSARHLYNVRYATNANFSQKDDIDLNGTAVAVPVPVTNFAPIPDFNGTYTASYLKDGNAPENYVISNLKIDLPAKTNVGLFASINGVSGDNPNRASLVGLTLENPNVRGDLNVGSVCGSLNGFITGIYVKYTNENAVTGAGAVGGIVGKNDGTITDVTFVSPTTKVHVAGTDASASAIGGLVGQNNGTLKRAMFLALAPANASKSEIYPIIGTGSTIVPTLENQLYYLSGAAEYPEAEALGSESYNAESANYPNAALGLGTFELYNVCNELDESKLPGWKRDLNSGEPLIFEEATDKDSDIYPYPYSKFSQNQIAFKEQWPIVDGLGDVKFSNIAYYEKYEAAAGEYTYGLWFMSDGYPNDSSLDSGKTIAEAGYAIVLEEELISHHFFASTNGSDWQRVTEMTFAENTAFNTAAKENAAWVDKDKIFSFLLPLDKLSDLAKTSNALHIMYTNNTAGTQPQPIDGYLHPLFAKGLYRTANPSEFYVRTQWQMRNINTLIGTTNYTNNKTFTQERDIDYTHTGIGVNVKAAPTNVSATLNGPAIGGEFLGTYQGKNQSRSISKVDMKADSGDTALFMTNKGTIKNITITDSAIVSQNSSAAGIAVTNNGRIENCKVIGATAMPMSITGNLEISGVALTNTGTILGATVENVTLTSWNGTSAGITGENSGRIEDCKVAGTATSMSIIGNHDMSGIALTNTSSGTILRASVENVKIYSQNAPSAGIVITNDGSVSNVSVKASTEIRSDSHSAGGVARQNNGTIINATVQNSTITSKNTSAAGIAAYNGVNGKIEGSAVTNVTIDANSTSGGVARQNFGSIVKTNVRDSKITSTNDSAGGIAGFNSVDGIATGKIEKCTVISTEITGREKTGGAVGDNQTGATIDDKQLLASIKETTVENSTIKGSGGGDNIGGIAGSNNGVLEDCMVRKSTLSNGVNNIGGIAGENTDTGSLIKSGVEYSTVTGDRTSVGGVVGSNSGKVEDVFFLSTSSPAHSAKAVSDSGGGIAGINTGDILNALYLASAPRSITGSGENEIITIYPIVRDGNNGEDCFYLSGYRYSLNEGRNWTASDYNRATKEEYVKGGGEGLVTSFIDKSWLSFAHQASFDNWLQPTSGYPYPIIRNGMSVPANWPVTDSPIRPDQLDREDWSDVYATSNRAQNLDFVNGDFAIGNFNELDVVDDPGANRRLYVNMNDVSGWYTRPVNNVFSAIFQGNQGNPTPSWRLMELQEPVNVNNASMLHDYMYSNYQGKWSNPASVQTSPYRYAELNAEVQGTLYQVCPTTPGAQFFYSFYHSSRISGANTTTTVSDKMSFYLSGIDNNAKIVVENESERAARDAALTLIRPCESPRRRNSATVSGSSSSSSTAWNSVARQTVAYGRYNLNYHNGKSYLQPTGETKEQTISGNKYLYDVWISGLGYGITFWSDTNVTNLSSTGYTSLTAIPSSVRSNAQNNVIGYWGVEYGWKHYYGMYTVPEGQTRTEFAYQSNTNNPTNGNYLDGIAFKSPAFLSIDKYVKKDGADVKFVKPGDNLTVELHVESWGELPADNITITDQLAPFHSYIDYMGGVTVKAGDNAINNATITAPDSTNKYTLTVKLPEGVKLEKGDKLIVSFNIKARTTVLNFDTADTLLYFFRNQAIVSYCGDSQSDTYKLTAYKSNVYTNGSGPEPVKVFIDPIKLTKTVETVGISESPDPLIDGPFKVTLTIENTLDGGAHIDADGLISDAIPAGFQIVDTGNLPDGCIVDDYTDNSTRIAISGEAANLNESQQRLVYYYTLKYVGDGYGVAYTNASADYKYLYDSGDIGKLGVKLEFPKPVVGVKVKTENDAYVKNASGTHVLDITANDNFLNKLADDNYNVSPEVVLTDADGNPMGKNSDLNYWDNKTDKYTAVLTRGNNKLEFTPKNEKGGTYTLYYKIDLIATKSGGSPESFALSSEVTEITVIISGDQLVYFEQYGEDDYGLYSTGAAGFNTLDLDNREEILETGYGILSTSPDKVAQLDGEPLDLTPVDCNEAYLYKLNVDAAADTELLTVSFGDDAESMLVLGKFHPNFAKAVYSETEYIANAFAIRTPQQMQNISALTGDNEDNATKGISFTQERDLDFSGFHEIGDSGEIDMPVATGGTTSNNSIVTGVFEGTFAVATSGTTGGGEPNPQYIISNVTIDSQDNDDVGLFSKNNGVIRGITLKPDTSIIGRDNVGGIAGHNMSGGIIEDCIVEGELDAENFVTYIGMHIEGNENVGGIAGWNDGEIIGCTVRNTTQTIKGNDYVGGIAGYNDGTVVNATVLNVKLEAPENSNFGNLMGGGDGDASGTDGNVTVETFDAIMSDTAEADSEADSEPPDSPDAKEPEEPEGVVDGEADEAEGMDEPEGESEADGENSEMPDGKEPDETDGVVDDEGDESDETDTGEAEEEAGEATNAGEDEAEAEDEAESSDAHLPDGGYSPQ